MKKFEEIRKRVTLAAVVPAAVVLLGVAGVHAQESAAQQVTLNVAANAAVDQPRIMVSQDAQVIWAAPAGTRVDLGGVTLSGGSPSYVFHHPGTYQYRIHTAHGDTLGVVEVIPSGAANTNSAPQAAFAPASVSAPPQVAYAAPQVALSAPQGTAPQQQQQQVVGISPQGTMSQPDYSGMRPDYSPLSAYPEPGVRANARLAGPLASPAVPGSSFVNPNSDYANALIPAAGPSASPAYPGSSMANEAIPGVTPLQPVMMGGSASLGGLARNISPGETFIGTGGTLAANGLPITGTGMTLSTAAGTIGTGGGLTTGTFGTVITPGTSILGSTTNFGSGSAGTVAINAITPVGTIPGNQAVTGAIGSPASAATVAFGSGTASVGTSFFNPALPQGSTVLNNSTALAGATILGPEGTPIILPVGSTFVGGVANMYPTQVGQLAVQPGALLQPFNVSTNTTVGGGLTGTAITPIGTTATGVSTTGAVTQQQLASNVSSTVLTPELAPSTVTTLGSTGVAFLGGGSTTGTLSAGLGTGTIGSVTNSGLIQPGTVVASDLFPLSNTPILVGSSLGNELPPNSIVVLAQPGAPSAVAVPTSPVGVGQSSGITTSSGTVTNNEAPQIAAPAPVAMGPAVITIGPGGISPTHLVTSIGTTIEIQDQTGGAESVSGSLTGDLKANGGRMQGHFTHPGTYHYHISGAIHGDGVIVITPRG